MSYPLDIAAQNAALDALFGTGLPAAFEVAIFDVIPSSLSAVELTGTGGVSRPVVTNDSSLFPTSASAGRKVCAVIPLDDATGDWAATGRYWLFIDASDHTTRWWYGQLADDLPMVDGQTDNQIQPAIYWNTLGA